MNAVARIEQRNEPVLGLELADGMNFDEWVEIGRKLCVSQQAVQWKIGDWWAFGDHRYGDRAKAAAEGIFGLSFGTLQVYGTVARAFEPLSRLKEVPFAHHQEVASLPPETAAGLLNRAAREGLSTRDLRREVQALRTTRAPPRLLLRRRP
jgi:hypothetical protein